MKITIRAARVNAGLTQAEAAQQIGIARCTLNRWERGRVRVKWENMVKLCKLYNVPTSRILHNPGNHQE